MPHRHLAPLLAALLALAVQAAPGNGDTGTQPEDRSHLPQLGDPYLPPAARKPVQRTPLAGAALQAQARAKLQQRFAAADTLKTGSISLAQAKAAPAFNAWGYVQSRRASEGNADFLNALVNQLHVPRDEALAAALTILGGKPACPLGGKYQATRSEAGDRPWRSSAWPSPDWLAETQPPPGYVCGLLKWFRGLEVEFYLDGQQAMLRTEVDLK